MKKLVWRQCLRDHYPLPIEVGRIGPNYKYSLTETTHLEGKVRRQLCASAENVYRVPKITVPFVISCSPKSG